MATHGVSFKYGFSWNYHRVPPCHIILSDWLILDAPGNVEGEGNKRRTRFYKRKLFCSI